MQTSPAHGSDANQTQMQMSPSMQMGPTRAAGPH